MFRGHHPGLGLARSLSPLSVLYTHTPNLLFQQGQEEKEEEEGWLRGWGVGVGWRCFGVGVLELVWWSEESYYMFSRFSLKRTGVCDAIYDLTTFLLLEKQV